MTIDYLDLRTRDRKQASREPLTQLILPGYYPRPMVKLAVTVV